MTMITSTKAFEAKPNREFMRLQLKRLSRIMDGDVNAYGVKVHDALINFANSRSDETDVQQFPHEYFELIELLELINTGFSVELLKDLIQRCCTNIQKMI